MRLLRLWILLVLAMAIVGCGAPRIDSSSEEKMARSIRRVRASLPEDRRAKFDEAFMAISFSGSAAETVLAGGTPNSEVFRREIMSALDGKTAEEVIAEGERVAKSGRLDWAFPRQ